MCLLSRVVIDPLSAIARGGGQRSGIVAGGVAIAVFLIDILSPLLDPRMKAE